MFTDLSPDLVEDVASAATEQGLGYFEDFEGLAASRAADLGENQPF